MFDNSKFEDLLVKKDIEGIKLYFQYIASSDKSEEIYSAAKAAYFFVSMTKLPFDFISEIKEPRFVEMLRRFLFCFMRNNPPGVSRQRVRKVLASMGFLRAEPHEAPLSPEAWFFNEALYRYELTGKPGAFSKPAKLILAAQDPYAFHPVLKLLERCPKETAEAMLSYFEKDEYLSNKNMRLFLKNAGRQVPEEEEPVEAPAVESAPAEESPAPEPEVDNVEAERIARIKADMQKKREQERLKKKSSASESCIEPESVPESGADDVQDKSVESAPAVSVESSPAVSVESSPAVSVESTPAVSVESASEVSVESSPAVSVESSPAVSVESSPAVSVESAPVVSVESSPAVSVESSPAVSVESSPAVSVESSPEVSVESAPVVSVEPVPSGYEKNLEKSEKRSEELRSSLADVQKRKKEAEEARAEQEKREHKSSELLSSLSEVRRAKSEEEARIEEEARLKAEEEARLKVEEETRRRIEEEARLKAEEYIRRRIEESRLKAEEEARLKAEEEARLKAEEDARLKAEEEARLKAEEEARLKAEEEARLKAEEEARRKAEEEARRKAEEEARRKAEEEARANIDPGEKALRLIKANREKNQRVNISMPSTKPNVSEEILARSMATIMDTTPAIIKSRPDQKGGTFVVPAPKISADEPAAKPETSRPASNLETSRPAAVSGDADSKKISGEITENLRKIASLSPESLPTDLTTKTLEMILDRIRNGNEWDLSSLKENIREFFTDGFVMKDMLRRELKVFMADSEQPEHVSRRATELLPMLGAAKKSSPSSLLMTISSELDDEPEKSHPEVKKPEQSRIPTIEEDLAFPVCDFIMDYLKMTGSCEAKAEFCSDLITKGMKFDEYSKLLDFNLLKSGRILFDKMIPAAKAMVLGAKRYEYQKGMSKAKNVLLYSLYYLACPDILKMEAFEALRRTGFLNFSSADIYKKYALAFAKDALLKKTTSAPCRALSDLISLKMPAISRESSFEGKGLVALSEEFADLVIKESNREVLETALDILHHISVDEPLMLRSLSNKVQPLNYEKALEIMAGLVRRKNLWASSFLVDSASHDNSSIRTKAVIELGSCCDYLTHDMKSRAVSAIIDRIDECYDDEMQKKCLESAVRIDAAATVRGLVDQCLSSGLADRKEKGARLLEVFRNMKADDFSDIFSDVSNLRSVHRYLTSLNKDDFTVRFSGDFIDLCRINFTSSKGDDYWEKVVADSSSEFTALINEIWNLSIKS